MTIRKTAAAEGIQVENGPITKTAAQQSPWGAEDEEQLAEESGQE